jgi:hypothetical protein
MKNLCKKFAILSIAMIVFGCSKDGEIGPQGPAGTNGSNGTNGTNGNANVLGSGDFTITPTDWLSSGNTKYVNISNSVISQQIVNTGVVMVYQKVNNNYIALPFSSGGFDYRFAFGLNNLQIIVSTYNNTAFTVTSNFTIRYVVISSTNKMAGSNINWQNYEEVKYKFNLKD